MNKDVIYIEPEDDITDIITKLENSKEKIVALVPPKKAGVFRSIVNIKLIAKAGASAEKTVVLVTTDPSIIKLAAATRLPVTKNLQTAPTIPDGTEDEEEKTESTEEVVETTDENGEEKVVAEEIDDEDEDEEEPEEETKAKKDKKANEKKPAKEKKKEAAEDKKLDNPVFNWIREHKKISIAGGIGLVVLILILIWAFAIAPAAKIVVGVHTSNGGFSGNATFTDKLNEENASEGKFYLEEKKIENKAEVEFTATGSKNIGEKATGNLIIYAYFSQKGTVGVNTGDKFTIGDLTFVADSNSSLAWDGSNSSCENDDVIKNGVINCRISGRINVTAAEPGEKYNIAASSANWKTIANVAVFSDAAMAGGTDNVITVVQQSDIDAAVAKIKTDNEATNKEKLFETIDEGAFIIEESFKQNTGDAVSTPALGEAVENGKKAKLTIVTTNSVYIIDRTKVEEFITEKAKLAENYKIYSMEDPFIENFKEIEGGYVGKIKTSYKYGSKVTQSDIVELARGKGVGTAQHELSDAFDGISIDIQTSFPWVTTIPNDENKIKVEMKYEE